MILVDGENNLECEVNSRKLNFIIIENNIYFQKFISDIYNQINKIEENLILYNGDYDMLDMNKFCDVIFSTMDISLQNSKINKKFIKYLQDEIIVNDINERFIANHSQLVNILDEFKNISDYEFVYNDEYSLDQILKNNSVKLKEYSGSFAERLIEYIKVSRDFLNINIFFLVGCKIYFSDSDYEHLKKWTEYQDITCIFIERDDTYMPLNANKYILDRDMCIIH